MLPVADDVTDRVSAWGWPHFQRLATADPTSASPWDVQADRDCEHIAASRKTSLWSRQGPQVRRLWAQSIATLLLVYEKHPQEPRVLYEVGGAYDTAGEETTALGFYERAMIEGLEGDVRHRCYLQYGSTPRNLGRLDESVTVFAQARKEFPDSVALGAFEALSLHAAGQVNTALGSLLALLADHMHSEENDRYKPALRGNAEYLTSLDSSATSGSTR